MREQTGNDRLGVALFAAPGERGAGGQAARGPMVPTGWPGLARRACLRAPSLPLALPAGTGISGRFRQPMRSILHELTPIDFTGGRERDPRGSRLHRRTRYQRAPTSSLGSVRFSQVPPGSFRVRAYMSSARAALEAAIAERAQMKVSLRLDQVGFSDESRRVVTLNRSNGDGQVGSLLRLTCARLAAPPASLPESLASPGVFSAFPCMPRPTGGNKLFWHPRHLKVGTACSGPLARISQD